MNAQAIATFQAEISNATCMGTRRDCVIRLAKKIGSVAAIAQAINAGLRSSYYHAQLPEAAK